jgi:uncharacterized protein involved in exopolysaccharide biosynthesis
MNSVIIKPSFEPSSPSPLNSAPSRSVNDFKREIIRSFRMHRVWAISAGIVIFVGLAAFAMRRTAYYKTSALVYVQPMKSKSIAESIDGAYDPIRYDSYIQQQLQTIRRSDILTAALKEAAKRTGRTVWVLPGESDQSAVARLQSELKVEREEGSYQLSISLGGNDPVTTTTVVNAVVDSYITKERMDELAQSDQQLEVLKKDQLGILEELDESSQEQVQLSTILGVADLANDSDKPSNNPYDVQLTQLRTQLADARAAHAIADAKLSSVTGTNPESANSLNAAAEEVYTTDPGLAALKATISQRRSVLATQMAGLTPKNPLYKQDQDELKLLDKLLDTNSNELRTKAAQQVIGELKLQSARTGEIETRLANELQHQTSIASGATPKLQRAAFLAAKISRLQHRLTDVDNAISALELEHSSSGSVHVLLPAEQPLKPVASRKWLILAAALPCGIGFGLATAFFRHKLDPKIYIGEEVATALSFPPMAVLPNTKEIDPMVFDEFMLRLVAGIDQAHSSGGARTYVFTAVSSETNISDLVASLALKMDRLGYRTMILKASAALQNLSLGNEEGSKVWSEGRLAKLSETRLTELRRASFVVENLERLKQNVDLLFIEALPLLSSAEAEFAARLADVTILVAESGQTTGRELTNSLALVRRLNVPGIAAVLNNVELQHADDEFIAVVRNVESRQSEMRRRDEASIQRYREKYPLSIYENENPDSVDQNQETSASQ